MNDLVIDASSLFARSFFAAQNIRNIDMATDCPALSFAMRTLIHLVDPGRDNLGVRMDRMLAAWDGVQNHKKQRQPKPPEFHELKREFMDVLHAVFQPAQCEAGPDCEADDIVATAVAQSNAKNVYIVSGDKDLTQLKRPGVHFYDLNQKHLLSEHVICRKWSVKAPSHVALALAIIGDPVDSIKGIPRWGPAKVKKLFESVPDGAPLDEALRLIEAQIPEALQDSFWEALERTLLRPDVEGVDTPKEIVYADVDFVDRLGLGVGVDYEHLLRSLELA